MGFGLGNLKDGSAEARKKTVVSREKERAPRGVAGALFVGLIDAPTPEGARRDSGIESLVWRLNQSDPASALAWVDSVADPERRSRQLQITLQQWKQNDEAAARAAAAGLELSESDREVIERMFGE